MDFKIKFTFDQRLDESTRITSKYKTRIPIIVKSHNNSVKLNKYKYLVPSDLTVGQFLIVLRNRTTIKSDEAMYLFFNNSLESTSANIASVFKKHKDKDGFMYAVLSLESTFGC
jgi:GABA(A) receptor-associated protein